jgi:hypothetical protein
VTVNEIADHPPLAEATVHHTNDRLERAARLLPRRRFFSDMPDKGLFGLVALVGFAAICALKRDGYDADLIAVLAVAVMFGYGAIAYHMPVVQMRLDRLGDNFYYLGFIYTLASLSAALLQLRSGVQIELLLGSFGIALVTTIVGIAGRVLFVQLRSDLDDIEDRTRRDLAAGSADLRAQISASVREFETFRTGLLQTLKETTAECTRATKYQVGQIDALARSAAQQISGAFEANRLQSERLNETMQTVAKAVERTSQAAFEANRLQCERVNESMHNVAKAVEQTSVRVAAMELPSDRLSSQLATFAQELEALLHRLGAVIDDIARRSVPPRRRWYWPYRQ